MTPEQCNADLGSACWRCWHCQSTTGLEWWNGLSVAVCRGRPECRKAYSDFLARSVQEEEDFQEYFKENAPW